MSVGPLPAGYRLVVREHVFDTSWALDVTLREIEARLESSIVVERRETDRHHVREIRLLREGAPPLHVVYAIDHEKRIVVFITVYEPDLEYWRPGFRERRR